MKTNLITIFALIAICLGILILRGRQIGDLRREVSAARTLAANPDPVSPSPLRPQASNASPAEIEFLTEGADTSPSSTIPRIFALLDEIEDDNMMSQFRKMGEILKLLKGHSADEIFAVLKQLKENESDDSKVSEIFPFLLMSLSSVEPERTLAFLDTGMEEDPSSVQQLRITAFAAWAESDSEKARAYLEEQNWEDSEKTMAQKAILDSLAATDLREALDYFGTIKINPAMLAVMASQSARDPARREEAWELLEENLDHATHQALSSGLIGAIFFEGGLSGVDEILPRMKFANPKDRDNVLICVIDGGIWFSPGETMSWIQRELTPETQAEKIPDALQKWATRDFTAAGNWLKEQKPSSTKNAAIVTYATTVAKLDPKGALAWTAEITEEKSQNKARRNVLKVWHQAEPEAAAAWVDEKGLDRDQWLPKG